MKNQKNEWKTSIFWSKKTNLKLNFLFFRKSKKKLDGAKRWSISCLTLPLNRFCHNFNYFCDISSQNWKSRFFAVFGPILTLDINFLIKTMKSREISWSVDILGYLNQSQRKHQYWKLTYL